MIVSGAQPLELTLETLVRTRLPLEWASQEKTLRNRGLKAFPVRLAEFPVPLEKFTVRLKEFPVTSSREMRLKPLK